MVEIFLQCHTPCTMLQCMSIVDSGFIWVDKPIDRLAAAETTKSKSLYVERDGHPL